MVHLKICYKNRFGVPADQISFDEVAEHLTHNRKKRATVCSGQFASLTGSRTFDGSCNNLNFTDYGKSGTIHSRLLPPVYQDGLNYTSPNVKITFICSIFEYYCLKNRCRCSPIRAISSRHYQRGAAE